MNRIVAIVFVAAVSACASKPAQLQLPTDVQTRAAVIRVERSDRAQAVPAVRAALTVVESETGKQVMLVLPNNVDQSIYDLLGGLREVILERDLPRAPGYNLPAGYFVVEQLVVKGSEAQIVGLAGPVPSVGTAQSCGTRFRIPVTRSPEGVWVVGGFSLTVC